MKRTRGKTPINLKTLNRDLMKAPAILKPRHVQAGDHARLTIAPTWVSNGRWTVRRLALAVGPILSHDWLQVKQKGLVCPERDLLLRSILGITGDVRFELVAKEDRIEADLRKVEADDLVKYRRTRATYATDWTTYIVFRAESGDVLGVDHRWADLFALNYVWRASNGPILDNPDPNKVNVFFTDKGTLPEEAAFASFVAGYPKEQTEQ